MKKILTMLVVILMGANAINAQTNMNEYRDIDSTFSDDVLYTFNGQRINSHSNQHGIFIQVTGSGYKKVVK